MKRPLFIIGIIFVLLGALLYAAFALFAPQSPLPDEQKNDSRQLVEAYVRTHISELSPESAVLGGRWYVTDVLIEEHNGTVSFEDGHIARVGDFTYTIGEDGSVSITSFSAREAPPPPSARSGIRGMVLLGPTCPVVSDPPDPSCADKPYATRLAVTTADGARVIAEVESDASGFFFASLPPGTYAIRSAAAANVLPYCVSSEPIVVREGMVEVAVSCDTGIR